MTFGLQAHQRLRAKLDGLVEQRDVEVGDADVPFSALRLSSTDLATAAACRFSCDTLVVRKMSLRATPDLRRPSPTIGSVPYLRAASMWR